MNKKNVFTQTWLNGKKMKLGWQVGTLPQMGKWRKMNLHSLQQSYSAKTFFLSTYKNAVRETKKDNQKNKIKFSL